MDQTTRGRIVTGLTAALLLSATASAQSDPTAAASRVTARDGAASFEVATNMFGTTVQGKSSALATATVVGTGGAGLQIAHMEATLPAASLKTGIKLRDQHMLKYIFQTPDGQVPDVQFAGDGADCTRSEKSAAYTCTASGTLSLRGVSRPFTMALEVTPQGQAYHVKGDGTVALSAYGIPRPSQFGVKTEDEVKIHVEFTARAQSATAAGVR